MGKNVPAYFLGASKTLPRNSSLFRTNYTKMQQSQQQPSNQVNGCGPNTLVPGAGGNYLPSSTSSPERTVRALYEDPYYTHYGTRSNTMTTVIDEETSDTEIVEDSYSLYGVKIGPGTSVSSSTSAAASAASAAVSTMMTTRNGPPIARPIFPKSGPPTYDTTRIKVEQMQRQLANLTGLVQKALIQPQNLSASRDNFREEMEMMSNSSSTSIQDKSVSFEKSVSFSDEPPDEKNQKQHSPQHFTDTKPTKSAIKSSTLPRMSSQDKDSRVLSVPGPKPLICYNLNQQQQQQQMNSGLYRELTISPEIYNQLRCLQKKTKDIRFEMRNLRRLTQAQSHSIREYIRDTCIKLKTVINVRGDESLKTEFEQEKLRLKCEEDLYRQEIMHLEKDLTDLEITVEDLRTNVINRKTRVNMMDVENMALVLTRSSKTIAELKLKFPMLHDGVKMLLNCEMESVIRDEKFLKEEPDRLENALRRCKKLTGTLVTLKRLANVQEQRLPSQDEYNLYADQSNGGSLSNSQIDFNLSNNNNKEYATYDNLGQNEAKDGGNRSDGAEGNGRNYSGGSVSNCGGNEAIKTSRQENALDALLNELQTYSKPSDTINNNSNSNGSSTNFSNSNSLKRSHIVEEIGKKFNSTEDALNDKTNNNAPSSVTTLTSNTLTKRVPPPPPPRTSSKSPLISPTQKSDERLQQSNVQVTVTTSSLSQFEIAKQNLGLTTLKRNSTASGGSGNIGTTLVAKKSQTLPRSFGELNRNDLLDSQHHQGLLKKQKSIQEQQNAKLQTAGAVNDAAAAATASEPHPIKLPNQNRVYETDIL